MKSVVLLFLAVAVCASFCACSPDSPLSPDSAAKNCMQKISDKRISRAIEGARLALKDRPKFTKFVAYVSIGEYSESPETFIFRELKNTKNWEPDSVIPYSVDISISPESDANAPKRFSFVLREGANRIMSVSTALAFPKNKNFEFLFGGGRIESVSADRRIVKSEWVCVFTAGEK